ncbi:hypothetical protein AAVH_23747 [Aphelenchoides avenae]|nr:hypothetical protein AAVH_23747 [Aphelenchus avenae]
MSDISHASDNTPSGSKELTCGIQKESMPDVARKRSNFWSYFAKDFEVVDGQRTAVAYCKYCDARFLNSALQMAEHAQKCTKIVE